MMDIFVSWYDSSLFSASARVGIMIVIGVPALFIMTRMVRSALTQKVSTHIAAVVSNIIFYLGLGYIGVSLLNEFGFNVSALLGAAGVIGIAVGFAAQTSVSNIISGIFLILEQAFEVGDMVTCDSIYGKVESIDLLSVKLRTTDNQLVRIPNEFFVKRAVSNRSYYKKQRLEFFVRIPSHADQNMALSLIGDAIRDNSDIAKEPAPKIVLHEVTSYSLIFQVRFWTQQKISTQVHADYIAALHQLGIDNKCDLAIK